MRLTTEREAEIRLRAQSQYCNEAQFYGVPDLLAEIDRLRQELVFSAYKEVSKDILDGI